MDLSHPDRPMTPEEFQEAGQGVLEAIASHWSSKLDRPVAPPTSREDLFQQFQGTIKEEGLGFQKAADIVKGILPATMAMDHPLYLGLVNSSPLPAAVLGDLVVSAVDNNGGASHQGPAQAAAENEVVRWLAEKIGYPSYGMILPGGTFATLQGLQLAKHRHFPDWKTKGPSCLTKQPVLYCSSSVHFSATRSATMMGLGVQNIRRVESTGRGEMIAEKLVEAIQLDLAQGRQPFAVVATVGTTGTGAIDPIESIAEVTKKYQLWLHVDACYGGAIVVSPEQAELAKGMELADSIAIDLHKWFFMPLTAGICFTKHQEIAEDLYRVDASYIPGDEFKEAYERGMPTSRRSTGLAFWIAMKVAGWRLIANTIDRNIQSTRLLETLLAQEGFVVMPDGKLSIGCVRWEPKELPATHYDSLQVEIATHLCKTGVAWFSTTVHEDKTWIRFNPVNLFTTDDDIRKLVPDFKKAAVHVSQQKSSEVHV